jgi:hypothetical protein
VQLNFGSTADLQSVELNVSDPQAQGLVSWWPVWPNPSTFRDYGPAKMHGTPVVNPPVIAPTLGGVRAWDFTAGNQAVSIANWSRLWNGVADIAMFCRWVRQPSAAGIGFVIGIRNVDSTPNVLYIVDLGSSTNSEVRYSGGTGTAITLTTSTAAGVSAPISMLVTRTSEPALKVYVNGVLATSSTAASTPMNSGTLPWRIGVSGAYTTQFVTSRGIWDIRAYANRKFTDAEALDMHIRADALIRPSTRVNALLLGAIYAQTKFRVFNDDGIGLGEVA